MSQRMGMADGRCFTIHTSAQLLNDYIMTTNNINYSDNYSYRKLLQQGGSEILKPIQAQQESSAPNRVTACDKPLLNVSKLY